MPPTLFRMVCPLRPLAHWSGCLHTSFPVVHPFTISPLKHLLQLRGQSNTARISLVGNRMLLHFSNVLVTGMQCMAKAIAPKKADLVVSLHNMCENEKN